MKNLTSLSTLERLTRTIILPIILAFIAAGSFATCFEKEHPSVPGSKTGETLPSPRIIGIATCKNSRITIPDASIRLENITGGAGSTTGADGVFELILPSGFEPGDLIRLGINPLGGKDFTDATFAIKRKSASVIDLGVISFPIDCKENDVESDDIIQERRPPNLRSESPVTKFEPSRISVTVRDKFTNVPVAGARIIQGNEILGNTNDKGFLYFEKSRDAARFVLRCEAEGYESSDIKVGWGQNPQVCFKLKSIVHFSK